MCLSSSNRFFHLLSWTWNFTLTSVAFKETLYWSPEGEIQGPQKWNQKHQNKLNSEYSTKIQNWAITVVIKMNIIREVRYSRLENSMRSNSKTKLQVSAIRQINLCSTVWIFPLIYFQSWTFRHDLCKNGSVTGFTAEMLQIQSLNRNHSYTGFLLLF